MKYAELHEVAIGDFAINEMDPAALAYPHPAKPQELAHLVEIDETGHLAQQALCGFPSGTGHKPGYTGIWADQRATMYPQPASCPECEAKRQPG